MKYPITITAALAAVFVHTALGGTNLDDPTFDTMPNTGIIIYTSPEAEGKLVVKTSEKNAHEGTACLEIALPVAAYGSVSFPLKNTSVAMELAFAYRVEAGDGAEVKFGIQSFTMEGGFKSVDFNPLMASDQMGPEWRVFRGRIERAEGATHWQISVAINGPATVWIDQIEVQPE
jgi:hypothetical protein